MDSITSSGTSCKPWRWVLTGSTICNRGSRDWWSTRPPTPITGKASGSNPFQRERSGSGGLLGRVDVYMIWNLVLIVLGVAALSLSGKKALLGTLVIWLVFTLISLIPHSRWPQSGHPFLGAVARVDEGGQKLSAEPLIRIEDLHREFAMGDQVVHTLTASPPRSTLASSSR